jgi:UDP-2,3-diacylglucosamine pyrophosphatase LpxH
MKRTIDILVISDSHLGAFGSQAQRLHQYLESISPKQLIINGDLIDIWQFMKWYFPKSHLAVLQKLTEFISSGIPVYYLTGNHDDLLRRFTPINIKNFHLIDELTLMIDGKKTWVIHGDRYDKSIKVRWMAVWGGLCYNCLIVLDILFNKILGFWGKKKRIRISKSLKDFSKRMAKKMGNFEQEAIDMAIENGYDNLICGHIHKPQIRMANHENGSGSVFYLNSGDWVENATSLEYNNGEWTIFNFEKDFGNI